MTDSVFEKRSYWLLNPSFRFVNLNEVSAAKVLLRSQHMNAHLLYLYDHIHVHSLSSHFSLPPPAKSSISPTLISMQNLGDLALAPVYLVGKSRKRSSRRETSPKWA